METKMYELAYLGVKSPKEIILTDKGRAIHPASILISEREIERVNFIPFKAIKCSEAMATKLLMNAGDIFKRVDIDARKEDPKPVISGNGYVGDVHAAQIPNMKEQIEKDHKKEEGKDIDEVIAEVKKPKTKKKEE